MSYRKNIISLGNGVSVPYKKVSLNGVDDQYIAMQNSASGARGFYGWFKPSSLKNNGSGVQTFIQYQQASPIVENGGVEFNFEDFGNSNDGQISYMHRRTSDGVNFKAFSQRFEWKQNEWYFILGHTHSTRGLELYINGVLVGSNNGLTEAYRNNNTPVYLGGNISSGGLRFADIEVDSFGIIQGDIDPEDVISLMSYKPNGLENFCRAYWDFENYDSGSSLDVTGNYTATLNTDIGSADAMVLDSVLKDYYALDIVGNDQNHVTFDNGLLSGVRTILIKIKLKEAMGINDNLWGLEQSASATVQGSGSIWGYLGRFRFSVGDASSNTPRAVHSNQDGWSVTGKFIYIACVVDPTTGMRMLIDNVQQAETNSSTQAIAGSTLPVALGKRSASANYTPTDYEVKDIVLFNVALDNQTIEDYEQRRFDGTENGLVWHSQQMQGEGDKIYDFKTDNVGQMVSNNDTSKMWVPTEYDNVFKNNRLLHYDTTESASYPGSGTVITDLSGNTADGSLVNGITFDSIKKALVLNGTSQYIQSLLNHKLNPGDATYTVVIETNQNTTALLVSNYGVTAGASVQPLYQSAIVGGKIQSNIRNLNNSSTYPITGVTNINDGTKRVLTVRKKGDLYSVYVDGKIEQQGVQSGFNNVVPTTNIVFGVLNLFYNGTWFDGYFYGMVLYNKALTESEIFKNSTYLLNK